LPMLTTLPAPTIVVEHGPAAGHQSARVSPGAIALREVKPHPKFGAT
jgi:hypothetical protein